MLLRPGPPSLWHALSTSIDDRPGSALNAAMLRMRNLAWLVRAGRGAEWGGGHGHLTGSDTLLSDRVWSR